MRPQSDTTRQHILQTGSRIIAGKGFSSVGLNEILTAASVPKGSFYHYFKSKEQFGESLIREYFADYLERVDGLLREDGTSDAKQRLMRYWQTWVDSQSACCNERKCLVVKLSAEVSDLSEPMRLALRDGTEQIVSRLAACIRIGAKEGSLPPIDAEGTARTLYQLWLGASLLAKLHRTDEPMHQAMRATVALLG